jgi:signal transduction histidine kinase
MLRVVDCIVGQHDLRLVVLAAFLCVFASWSAVSLVSRARVSSGRPRLSWTIAAGAVFGAGVWATHFVAMLAYQSPMQIGYDLAPTLLSIVVAAGLSAIGFALVLRPGLAPLGGALLGVAVSAMHFVGMWAMEGPFTQGWNFTYVAASIVLCVSLATMAAIMGVSIRNIRGRIAATGFLVLSIVSLHFTAMTAVTLIPDAHIFYDDIVLAPGTLAIAVAAAALLIVALGLMAALLDNHLALRRTDEAARLRAHIVELEATQHRLEETTHDLVAALTKASAASDAKSAFLAAMSHELRTPLNAVIGFSEMVMCEAFGPIGNPKYRDYVADIHKSGAHLLNLINDVLDLSRLDSGGVALDEAETPLKFVVEEALAIAAPRADAANIRLSATYAPGLPHVVVDVRRIQRVLANILSNAIKFTPAEGSVQVHVACPQGVRITVTDTGIGIAKDDVAHAFERFGQVDSRLSRKYEGTGLGLPLARQLVELHGGTLTLESELNSGTTVTIVLPASRIVDAQALAAE